MNGLTKGTTSAENHRSIKYNNRALILKILCTRGPVSRIELSKMTGLSKMAVTNIINELVTKGFMKSPGIKDVSVKDACSPGRKPVLLDINPDFACAAGVYIGRDFCEISLCNLRGEVKISRSFPIAFDESAESFTKKIVSCLKGILDAEAVKKNNILGIGVASIGPLDIKNGVILEPPNFHNLKGIPIKSVLEKEFGLNTYVDNDMNASALAEKYYGKAVDIENFIYVGVTNGIGAGIMTSNVLYRGECGFSGEIGHATINFDGPKCPCGNIGCLELYASLPVIVDQARTAIELGAETSLSGVHAPGWQDIVRHAEKGDELCLKLIDKLCFYLSIGLTSIVNSFDPEVIFLGHDIALAGSLLTGKLASAVSQRMISSKYKNIKIETSKFINKSPIVGSCALVFEKLFNGETAEDIL